MGHPIEHLITPLPPTRHQRGHYFRTWRTRGGCISSNSSKSSEAAGTGLRVSNNSAIRPPLGFFLSPPVPSLLPSSPSFSHPLSLQKHSLSVCSIIISMVTIKDVKLSLMLYGSNLSLSSACSLRPLLSSVACSFSYSPSPTCVSCCSLRSCKKKKKAHKNALLYCTFQTLFAASCLKPTFHSGALHSGRTCTQSYPRNPHVISAGGKPVL